MFRAVMEGNGGGLQRRTIIIKSNEPGQEREPIFEWIKPEHVSVCMLHLLLRMGQLMISELVIEVIILSFLPNTYV